MTNYKIYYDYFDGVKVPIWLVIDTNANEINWETDFFSFHIQAPFDLLHSEDFNPYAMNLTITMNELTINSKENHVGINLNLLKKRLVEHEVDCNEITNFVIQLADIEELLQFDIGD